MEVAGDGNCSKWPYPVTNSVPPVSFLYGWHFIMVCVCVWLDDRLVYLWSPAAFDPHRAVTFTSLPAGEKLLGLHDLWYFYHFFLFFLFSFFRKWIPTVNTSQRAVISKQPSFSLPRAPAHHLPCIVEAVILPISLTQHFQWSSANKDREEIQISSYWAAS